MATNWPYVMQRPFGFHASLVSVNLLFRCIEGRLTQFKPRIFISAFALAERRQGRLYRKARVLGARFYQEKPSKFCHRIEGYWHGWRKRKGVAQS